MPESDLEAELITEQLKHTLDLLRAETAALRREQGHACELANQRLKTLEAQAADFEARLRLLADTATQFKLLASLATGGGLLSVILLLRELIQ